MEVQFAWSVPESGHKWRGREGRERLEWVEKSGYSNWRVPPVGLFRTFANINTKPEACKAAILDFANENGDILGRHSGETYEQKPDYAPLAVWLSQIARMKDAIKYWDYISDSKLDRATRTGARLRLHRRLAPALRDMTTPRCSKVVVVNKNLELAIRPANLLAYMWLTFARVVSGEIEEKTCPGGSKQCLGHIYIGKGPGLQKSSVTTCSPACRKRKERAEGKRK